MYVCSTFYYYNSGIIRMNFRIYQENVSNELAHTNIPDVLLHTTCVRYARLH